jgi:hypothetical protein
MSVRFDNSKNVLRIVDITSLFSGTSANISSLDGTVQFIIYNGLTETPSFWSVSGFILTIQVSLSTDDKVLAIIQ